MADARERTEWIRSANLMAIIAEPNRDRKRKSNPFSALDFMPEHLKPVVLKKKPDPRAVAQQAIMAFARPEDVQKWLIRQQSEQAKHSSN